MADLILTITLSISEFTLILFMGELLYLFFNFLGILPMMCLHHQSYLEVMVKSIGSGA